MRTYVSARGAKREATISNWSEIKLLTRDLLDACKSGAPIRDSWTQFRTLVRANEERPPAHLVQMLDLLESISKPRGEIAILDHGCGGGKTALYLLALGYTGISGVDVGGNCEALNRLLAEECSIADKRFYVYDGLRLPFADASMDFVLSQQVLEHVPDDVVDAYYREEGRVMRAGAIAYHEVPHRLMPYDSHMRSFFVHLAPRRMAARLYRALGRNVEFFEHHLFLRWPWVHARLARRYIGPIDDLTLGRLRRTPVSDDYEGNLLLRRGGDVLVRLPIVGAALSLLAMRTTITTKAHR